MSDEDVAPYADHYFEYDADQHVTKEIAQGAGCSSCADGMGAFEYSYEPSGNSDDYNHWTTKPVEVLPDTHDGIISENIVYTNYLGQVLLQVYHHVDTNPNPDVEQSWATYFRYDEQGRQ